MAKLNQNQNSKQSYLPDTVLKLYFTFKIEINNRFNTTAYTCYAESTKAVKC